MSLGCTAKYKTGTLQPRQKTYNNIHGYYRACIEYLFANLWLCMTSDRVPCGFLRLVPCARVLPQRWVDFRVVTGKLNYSLALRA